MRVNTAKGFQVTDDDIREAASDVRPNVADDGSTFYPFLVAEELAPKFANRWFESRSAAWAEVEREVLAAWGSDGPWWVKEGEDPRS